MRAAAWETYAGALAAFLNSATQVYMADLFTITLSGGGVLYYTSADVVVSVNGHMYLPGPVIKRDKTKLNVGISVDTLSVNLAADSSFVVNGVPILQFIAGGGFDGARLALDRAFTTSPADAWIGTLNLFTGRISDTVVSRYEATLNVNSDSELLNVMVPRNVYQAGCGNTLFDGSCGLAKSAYAVSAASQSATDATRTGFYAYLSNPSDYFTLGWAVCTAGANAGVGRTIKAYGYVSFLGYVVTVQPWPAAVAIGDTFTFYPGCDKRQSTCGTKFSNLARFRGFPYIPAPETVT